MKYLITILILIIPFSTDAQSHTAGKSIFLSGGIGIAQHSSSEDLYSKYLPSVLFQIGFGVPVYSNIFIYNRISFSSKSNFKAYSQIGPTNRLVEVTSSFSQLIYNGGIRYGIFISEDFILSISAGITYSLVNNKSFLKGELYQTLDNQNLYGYFGGIALEHKFPDSKISVFGEALYNYFDNNNISYRNKFSGTNLSAGICYYFQK